MSIKFVMPEQGQGWRHYKGGSSSLYVIVGVGVDHDGVPTVAYAPYGSTYDDAPIYFQPLGRFLQHIDVEVPPYSQLDRHKQRFVFEREAAAGVGVSLYIRQR